MRITDLYIYPVKGCRGIRLDQSDVTLRGLEYDRTMMVVDPDGQFITQRENTALARLVVLPDDNGVTFRMDGHPELVIGWDEFAQGANTPVRVWKNELGVSSAPNKTDAWFAAALGQPARLVLQREHHIRETKQERAPGGIVSFADGYPFLIASASSLDDLNAKIVARGGEPVTMDRFRPNIVVDGLEPWAEDQIGELSFGDLNIKLVRPCTRCVVTTTDQQTGTRMGKEPLATLAKFRQSRAWEGVVFGENGYSLQTGHLLVGDVGKILASKSNLQFEPPKWSA